MNDNDNYNNEIEGKYAYDVYQSRGMNDDNMIMDEGAGVAQEAMNMT